MSPPPVRVRVGRSLAATLGAAWACAIAGLLLGLPALAIAALLLGAVALLGARVPKAAGAGAELAVPGLRPDEGDAVPVAVAIRNAARRPLVAEWRLELPGLCSAEGAPTAGQLFLPGRGATEVRLAVAFRLFGLNRIGPVDLRLTDAFGFLAVEQRLAEAVEVSVHPRRERIHGAPLRAKQKRAVMGAYEVAQTGDGFEFYGLRDYAFGDRPRDVNWKASARAAHLVVNQHQKENDAEVVLLVDARADSRAGLLSRSPFAQACRDAVTVAEAHLRARDAVRFIAYGQTLHQDSHTGAVRHLQGILDLVVGLEPTGTLSLSDVVHHVLPSLRPGSPVLLFSGLVGDPSVVEAVALLRGHHFQVKVVAPAAVWGERTPLAARQRWDAEHAQAMETLRGIGVPTAQRLADAPFEQALLRLEVLG